MAFAAADTAVTAVAVAAAAVVAVVADAEKRYKALYGGDYKKCKLLTS